MPIRGSGVWALAGELTHATASSSNKLRMTRNRSPYDVRFQRFQSATRVATDSAIIFSGLDAPPNN
jgi:hypothetical protein